MNLPSKEQYEEVSGPRISILVEIWPKVYQGNGLWVSEWVGIASHADLRDIRYAQIFDSTHWGVKNDPKHNIRFLPKQACSQESKPILPELVDADFRSSHVSEIWVSVLEPLLY